MLGKIDIQEVMEHEDGSATIVFDCDDEATKALISEGFISLIEKAMDRHKEGENKDED